MEEISRVAKVVKTIIKEKNVKIFSHYDADGITSSSIFSKALLRENVNFQLRILKQLTKENIDQIKVNKNDFLVFLDLGSGQLNFLKKFFDDTQILIIDHHYPEKLNHFNLFHLNPLLFGYEDLPASILTYQFVKHLDKKNADLVDLAIVGAMADEIEDSLEKKELSKKIFYEAEAIGKLSISPGLRFYGRNKPIHKSLAFSFNPFIPGISGSESQAVQFLSEIGIPIMHENNFRTLKDLTLEEQQKLATALIFEKIKAKEKLEDIFGNVYTLIGKPEEIQDAKEFGTIINACGRTNRIDLAVRLCLEDYSSLSKCIEVLDDYRKVISDALILLKENKDMILENDKAKFILGESKIPDTIIGTIISIILNSEIDNQKPIFGFSYTSDGMIKVSARAPTNLKINLADILKKASSIINGEAGGHEKAAGALIPKDKQFELINIISDLL